MSTKPPDYIPTWATDGGAVVTDPGPAKQATGWINNEVPSAGNVNSLFKQGGGWTEFLLKTLAPAIGWGNMKQTGTSPLPAAGGYLRLHISYNDDLGKYFAAVNPAGAGVTYYAESLDGITWPTTFSPGSLTTSQIATDGVNLVAFHYETELYTSTTGSVTGFTYGGNNGCLGLRSNLYLVYDKANDYYVVMSSSGEVMTLNNAVDDVTDELDWTCPGDLSVDAVNGMAASPNGTILVTRASGTAISADGGQTWQEQTISGTVNLSAPIWSPSTNAFVAIDVATQEIHFFREDGSGVSTDTNIICEGLVVHDDFVLVVGGQVSTDTAQVLSGRRDAWAFQGDADNYNLQVTRLGAWDTKDGVTQAMSKANTGDGTTSGDPFWIIECTGGARNLVWTYGVDNLAHMQVK